MRDMALIAGLESTVLLQPRINEEQFRDWISKHPRLYNSYFEGFHNYVW